MVRKVVVIKEKKWWEGMSHNECLKCLKKYEVHYGSATIAIMRPTNDDTKLGRYIEV